MANPIPAMWAYDAIVAAYPAAAVTSTPRSALSALLTEFARQREEIERLKDDVAHVDDIARDQDATLDQFRKVEDSLLTEKAALSSQLERLGEVRDDLLRVIEERNATVAALRLQSGKDDDR